jgi:hypothetical protein
MTKSHSKARAPSDGAWVVNEIAAAPDAPLKLDFGTIVKSVSLTLHRITLSLARAVARVMRRQVIAIRSSVISRFCTSVAQNSILRNVVLCYTSCYVVIFPHTCFCSSNRVAPRNQSHCHKVTHVLNIQSHSRHVSSCSLTTSCGFVEKQAKLVTKCIYWPL